MGTKKQYTKIRAEWIEYLGGVCSVCGSRENLIISNNIDNGFVFGKQFAQKKAKQYINDHRLLCNNCYKNIVSSEAEAKCKHGTFWKYKKWGCRCFPCETAYKKYAIETTKKYRSKKKNNCKICGEPCLKLYCGRKCANPKPRKKCQNIKVNIKPHYK